jgi:hypothetical protein
MSESSEHLRTAFANRLAELAMSADGSLALRLLKNTNVFRTPSVHNKESNSALEDLLGWESGREAEGCNRIGIWERKGNASYFSRRPDLRRDWSQWANIARIDAKSAKRRVILLGESVARGYLYDPQFTPAMALQSMLEGYFGKNNVEVIDLAQLGAGFGVGELALLSLALEPDAAIMFAGNNWRPTDFRGKDVSYADSAIRQQGLPGIKQLYEDRLADKVRLLIDTVASVYEERKIPLLWIIPEFNLEDWRDPVSAVPYLTGDASARWISYQQMSSTALQEGNISKAFEAAKKMVDLDRGVDPAGLYLLAECSQRQGDLKTKREYLEAARDAGIWHGSVAVLSPRPFSLSQKIVREEAIKFERSDVLDLPKLFYEYLGGGLPDRRLFLDYCHMTSEGIRVSMAAAASHIVRALGETVIPWQALLSRSPSPSCKVEAEAAFAAAIHNAHNHQGYDLIHHYCLTALSCEPQISEVMIRFAKVQAQGKPIFLSEIADELLEMPWAFIEQHLFRQHAKTLDRDLVNAIGSSLESFGIGASAVLTKVRKDEHGVRAKPTDLLDSYYCSAANQPRENLWAMAGAPGNGQQDYYRAYGAVSRFFFVADALCPVSLALTCRLPNLPPGSIEVRLNGKCQCEIVADTSWVTWDLAIGGDVIVDGVNEITIHWPTPLFSAFDALCRAADDLVRERSPQFYCSFGDIHCFTVKTAAVIDPSFDRSVSPLAVIKQ